ncbi:four-carbon acid sugar kinase family protein [Sediminivirga luteola]|nr:nucleotide-binding domain containing protein [Sediminivirga luteola]
MTESDVRALLAAQSRLPVSWVSHEAVRGGVEVLSSALAGITTSPRAIVVDAISNDDLGVIARAVRDDVLVSGGSGLALGLPGPGTATSPPPGVTSGRRLIVCGSASQRSREQIRHALDTGMPAWKVDIRQDDEAGRLRRWLGQRRADDPDAPVLVYATDSLDDLGDDDAHAARAAAIERLLANVVVSEVAAGTRSVIVAGGETSGSVVQALGIRQLRIVTQIAPGVSWAVAETASGEPVALALKSGNFGGTDFFTSAWEALS